VLLPVQRCGAHDDWAHDVSQTSSSQAAAGATACQQRSALVHGLALQMRKGADSLGHPYSFACFRGTELRVTHLAGSALTLCEELDLCNRLMFVFQQGASAGRHCDQGHLILSSCRLGAADVRGAGAVAQPHCNRSSTSIIALQLEFSFPTGSALPMFEELELWDSLILCYQMLGKAPQVCL